MLGRVRVWGEGEPSPPAQQQCMKHGLLRTTAPTTTHTSSAGAKPCRLRRSSGSAARPVTPKVASSQPSRYSVPNRANVIASRCRVVLRKNRAALVVKKL